MSHTIEYRHITIKLDLAHALACMLAIAPDMEVDDWQRAHHDGTAVLQFVEAGSNNTIDNFTNKPARRWCLAYLGTDLMDDVIERAKSAESYMLRLKGRDTPAERYISFHRKQLEAATDLRQLPLGATPQGSIATLVAASGENMPSGVYTAMKAHPFTPFVSRHWAIQVAEGAEPLHYEVPLNLSDPQQRYALLGWFAILSGYRPSPGLIRLHQNDRSELDRWLERIDREYNRPVGRDRAA